MDYKYNILDWYVVGNLNLLNTPLCMYYQWHILQSFLVIISNCFGVLRQMFTYVTVYFLYLCWVDFKLNIKLTLKSFKSTTQMY